MTDQPKPVEGPVRFALLHLWELAPSGVASIEARAPRIIEVISVFLPHERKPTTNAVQRIGRLCERRQVSVWLDEGVVYSYKAGTFTVKRDQS